MNPLDRWITKKTDYIWNLKIIDDLKDHLDYIGLNYYFHSKLQFFPKGDKPHYYHIRNENSQTTDLDWEIYPEGFYKVLMQLKKYNLSIIITENGLADEKDEKRAKFIHDHLASIHRAIKDGVKVIGYLHWSLMDNFEWNKGFWPRFGLIEIDYQTHARKIRPSAHYYSKIVKTNSLISYEG